MQICKKKFEQEQSLVAFEQDSAGIEQGFAGLKQCFANYLGSNRILQGSWLHPPPIPRPTLTLIPFCLGLTLCAQLVILYLLLLK